MSNVDNTNESEIKAASLPALVEHFSIEGLHGYKTISLSSKFAATILIAKNGSGKTTLLGALDAFLKGEFSRLTSLPFSRIFCKLRGIDETLILSQEDVIKLSSFTENSYLLAISKQYGIDPLSLVDFIDNEYGEDGRTTNIHSEVYEAIQSKVGFSSPEVRKICDRLRQSLGGRSENAERIRQALRIALEGIEVVYLPTYRRIELPLSVDPEEALRYGRRRKSVQSMLGISKRNLFNADINFGLSDISDRLARLNQEILGLSNQGYRETSASIINELLDGEFERHIARQLELPSKEALTLFFARIKEGEGRYFGPYNNVTVPDIDKIYKADTIASESNKFLVYYLSKLNRVIETTRKIELPVESFIDNCNRYLSASDLTATLDSEQQNHSPRTASPDDKMLRLDRRNLQVKVESVAGRRKMQLDALSSGEKQMVSLFARLYLYPGKKLFLIDEPELSLSIDWQRKILLDIITAPQCAQAIAITHSPFVFDNSLEPFAQPLTLMVNNNPATDQLFDDEELPNG
jgi:predicted ATPase